MSEETAPKLPTVPGAPFGCFSLLAINDGVPIDRLSPHTKAAAAVILHRYAKSIFSKRQLAEIIAAASTDKPTRLQLKMLDGLSMRLAQVELQTGRALDG